MAIEANVFQLSGDGLHISFSATSITGEALFTYQSASQHIEFRGSQIKIEPTAIGDLVSVVIFHGVDRNFTTFSAAIPKTLLGPSGGAVNVTTFGVTTLHRTSVVGPPVLGQTELYTTHHLHGAAQFVVS